MSFRSSFLVILFVILTPVGPHCVAAPLQCDAIAKAEALEAVLRTKNWRGVILEQRSIRRSTRQSLDQGRRIEFCFCGERKRFEIEREPPLSGQTAYAVNDRYAFTVNRDTRETGYTASDYYPGSDGTTAVFLAIEKYSALPLASVMVDGRPIRDLVATCREGVVDAGDSQTVVTLRERDGSATYRVLFQHLPAVRVAEWSVRYGEYVVEQNQTYFPIVDGIPYPQKIIRTIRTPQGAVLETTTYTFEPPTRCQIASEEFQLTHYGLPEVNPSRVSGWVIGFWLMLFVVVAFLLLVGKNSYRSFNRSRSRFSG